MAKHTIRRWARLGFLLVPTAACSLDLARLTQGSGLDEGNAADDSAQGGGAPPGAGPAYGVPWLGDPAYDPGDGAVPGTSGDAYPLVTKECPKPPSKAASLFCLSFREPPASQAPLQQVRDGSLAEYRREGGLHDAGALFASVREPAGYSDLRGKAYFRSPSLGTRGLREYVARVHFWVDEMPPVDASGRATLLSFVSASRVTKGAYSQVALQLVVASGRLALEVVQQQRAGESRPIESHTAVVQAPASPLGYKGRWNNVELRVALAETDGPGRRMGNARLGMATSPSKPGHPAEDPTKVLVRGGASGAAYAREESVLPEGVTPAGWVPLFDDPWLEVGLPYTDAPVGAGWSVRVNDLFVFAEGS